MQSTEKIEVNLSTQVMEGNLWGEQTAQNGSLTGEGQDAEAHMSLAFSLWKGHC